MAEILLSLTIIGVVAAITLPSLTGNINERTWNTQRKALYARMSQALALMPSLNGYGKLIEATEDTSAVDTAAETFITEGLSKVMKINNICDVDHLSDCGIPDKITPLSGSRIINTDDIKTIRGLNSFFTSGNGIPFDIKAAAFETQNGESILTYYNPSCRPDSTGSHKPQPKMCANFLYDLNGKKGPNTFGKDIGIITALYPTDPVIVAPQPLRSSAGRTSQDIAVTLCKKQDPNSRIPNKDEIATMFYNMRLINIQEGNHYWSGTVISGGPNGTGWLQSFHPDGALSVTSRKEGLGVWCIKR